MTLYCLGDAMVDVVVRAEGSPPRDDEVPARVEVRPGGQAVNVARAFCRLGARGHVVAAVGQDPWARLLRAQLRREGVGLSFQRSGRPTGVVLSLVEGQRRTMYTQRGANADLRPQRLRGLRRGDGVYLSGYVLLNPHGEALVSQTFQQARQRGVPVFVDTPPAGVLAQIGPDRFLERHAGARALLTSESEAALLSAQAAVPAVAAELARRFPVVMVKRGNRGCWVQQGQSGTALPTTPLEDVEPTGAGDVFCAGFVCAHLRGREPVPAAEFAQQAVAALWRRGG